VCVCVCVCNSMGTLIAATVLYNTKGCLLVFGILVVALHPGKFYELEEFSSAYFPVGWHIVHDRLGDGCRVDFPIRLESKLKWSSTVYSKQDDGTLLPKPRTFTEMIYVSLVKVRCR